MTVGMPMVMGVGVSVIMAAAAFVLVCVVMIASGVVMGVIVTAVPVIVIVGMIVTAALLVIMMVVVAMIVITAGGVLCLRGEEIKKRDNAHADASDEDHVTEDAIWRQVSSDSTADVEVEEHSAPDQHDQDAKEVNGGASSRHNGQ
jgi:hypothetical protein